MKKHYISLFFALFISLSLMAQSSITSSISTLKANLKSVSETQASIELSWEIPSRNNISSFIIYRDNSQITKDTLLQLKPLAELTGSYTRFTDTVTNLSKPYYYCVTTKTFEGENFNIIIPMVNSTVTGIIPKPITDNSKELTNKEGFVETAQNERKLVPLPYLNELNDANTDKLAISESSLKYARKSAKSNNVKKAKQLQILNEDKVPGNGEQYLLSIIVNGSFKAGKWDIAQQEINNFLKMNRSEQIVNRSYFYLGQIYYYKGDSKNAIYSFMKSQSECPIESRQWIDEVLNSLSM